MIIGLFLLICLCFYKIKFAKYHLGYMDIKQTESIKGIFAILILFSHFRQYIDLVFEIDAVVIKLLDLLSQLIVVVFFFYSGYGVMQSLRIKPNYTNSFFKKRIVKTVLRFDIIVVAYLFFAVLTGSSHSLEDYLLCWIGWTSIGNSNWFVFVVLSLYVITWIALKLFTKSNQKVAVFVSLLSIGLGMGLLLLGKQSWWYNTLLCYPFGMWFALFKSKFDNWMHNPVKQTIVILVSLIGFLCFYLIPGNVAYSICACFFCLIITLVTVSVRIDNVILRWLGKHAFDIYIIQRLPMMALKYCGLDRYAFLYFVLSVVVTLLLSALNGGLMKRINKLLGL